MHELSGPGFGNIHWAGLCVQLHPLLTEDRACKHEVDYHSACLVKDGAREKKNAPSGFLDVIFNCHITGEIVD